eukprot:15440165-Alexandrium_andersonii.AAC.1
MLGNMSNGVKTALVGNAGHFDSDMDSAPPLCSASSFRFCAVHAWEEQQGCFAGLFRLRPLLPLCLPRPAN